jgi:hypothetical protein
MKSHKLLQQHNHLFKKYATSSRGPRVAFVPSAYLSFGRLFYFLQGFSYRLSCFPHEVIL